MTVERERPMRPIGIEPRFIRTHRRFDAQHAMIGIDYALPHRLVDNAVLNKRGFKRKSRHRIVIERCADCIPCPIKSW